MTGKSFLLGINAVSGPDQNRWANVFTVVAMAMYATLLDGGVKKEDLLQQIDEVRSFVETAIPGGTKGSARQQNGGHLRLVKPDEPNDNDNEGNSTPPLQ